MNSVLQMSLAAAPLICGTALARTLLQHRIPPRVFLLLWNLAVCRLLAPFWVPVRGVAVKPLLNHVYGGIFNVTRETVALLDDRFLFAVWMVGAVMVLGHTLVNHYGGSVKWREAIPIEREAALRWQARQTGPRFIEVLQSDRADGPFSRGVLRPMVVFPSPMAQRAPEDALYQILAHEEAHLRGFHPLMRYALVAACCIHWFNPCVWLMLGLYNRDMELAADEKAMKGKSQREREAYAQTLEDMAKLPMGLGILIRLDAPNLKERTDRLRNPKRQSKVGMWIVIILLGAIFGLLVMVPRAALEKDALDNHHLYYGEDMATYSQRINAKGYVLLDKSYQ